MIHLYEVAGYLLSQGREDYAKGVLASADREADLTERLTREQERYDELRAACLTLKRPGPALRALLGFTDSEKVLPEEKAT